MTDPEAWLRAPAGTERPVLWEIAAEQDIRDYDNPAWSRDFLSAIWREQAFDPDADCRVAGEPGTAVGFAVAWTRGAGVFVKPEHEQGGVGARLLEWTETRQRARGRQTYNQMIAAGNQRAHDLLIAAGYRLIRQSHQMGLKLDATKPSSRPELPSGVSLRPPDLPTEAHALYEADARMFAHNPDFEPEDFSSFYEGHLADPDLAYEVSLIAWRGEKIAGFVLCHQRPEGFGFVGLLAVDPEERRAGLGRALLRAAFAGFARIGCQEARLAVASDNPSALRLYHSLGMRILGTGDIMQKPVA